MPISSVSPKPRLRFQALSALCSLPGEVERGEKFKTFIVSLLGVRQRSCGEKNDLNVRIRTHTPNIVKRGKSYSSNKRKKPRDFFFFSPRDLIVINNYG